MTKYRIFITEETAVKHEGWRFNTPEPILQVEDCEGYQYRYDIEEKSDYDCEIYDELFDTEDDAQEYIQNNLVTVIEFRDSWKHGRDFDNEISLNCYHIEEVKRSDIDEEWEFTENLGGYMDKIECIHDERKYIVIDNATKANTEFNSYDEAEEFGEDLDDYTIVLQLFKNGEIDEEIELN